MKFFLRITLALLSTFCALNCFSQVDLSKGLMAYYPFNGNAKDASGNGNDAIFNNAALTTNYYGNANSAYYFNGVDNYMEIANAESLNMQELSLCALVKVQGFYDGLCFNNCIIDKGYNDGEPGNYSLRFTQSAITNANCLIQDTLNQQFVGYAYSNPAALLYYPRVTKNVWSCVVYTVSADSLKLYVNGNLVWKEIKERNIGSNGLNIFLGKKNHPVYPFWFKGVMDEVRIYSRAIDTQEVKAYSVVCAENNNCDNWLKTSGNSSFLRIGDLDIPGNTITVEATFNRTIPYVGAQVYSGDLVSKHSIPADVNYLLRPDKAQIHTDNGYFETPDVCDIELNKTYHVALVYDGSRLKFYRNGFLLQDIPATGNLTQNNWLTQIGYDFNQQPNENFIGYINEVRIWNIARSQADIKTYMNKPLPNPGSQQGLLAYYTFDNLKNKQGNNQWDGTLLGNAAINQSNPTCADFVADSCSVCVPPLVSAGQNASICQGDSTMLQAFGATNYNWNYSYYLSDSTIANPFAFPAQTTNFIVTGYTSEDCFGMDTVRVIVNPLPATNAGNDVSICNRGSTQLTATGAETYSWSNAKSLSSGIISNPFAYPSLTTEYIVTGTNNFNCQAKDTVNVTVISPPVYAGRDTSVCGNNSGVELTASGAVSYIWTPSSGLSNPYIYNPVASPDVTMQYTVTGTDNYGCSNRDTVRVRVGSLPVFAVDPSSAICKGSNITLNASGGDYYKWSPVINTSLTDSVITVSPTETTTYSVIITDTTCAITDSLITSVTVNPLPDLRVYKSTNINCANPSSQLFALTTAGSFYIWSPDSLINDTTIFNPIVKPVNDTWYKVTVSTNAGCITKDSVLVRIEPQVKGEGYLVPDAFTPNGDGLNDCFQVKYWQPVKDFDISIFNRWGYRVYHSTDVNSCWNGYTNNKEQSPGTYIYQIKAFSTCSNTAIFKKGTVVLIK